MAGTWTASQCRSGSCSWRGGDTPNRDDHTEYCGRNTLGFPRALQPTVGQERQKDHLEMVPPEGFVTGDPAAPTILLSRERKSTCRGLKRDMSWSQAISHREGKGSTSSEQERAERRRLERRGTLLNHRLV